MFNLNVSLWLDDLQHAKTEWEPTKWSIAGSNVRNFVECWRKIKSNGCIARRYTVNCPQSHVFSRFGHGKGANCHANLMMEFQFRNNSSFLFDFTLVCSCTSLKWLNWKICKFFWRDICILWVPNHFSLAKCSVWKNGKWFLFSHLVHWGSWCRSFAVSVQRSNNKDTVQVISILS